VSDGGFALGTEAVEVADLDQHSLVRAQQIFVPHQEIAEERGERARAADPDRSTPGGLVYALRRTFVNRQEVRISDEFEVRADASQLSGYAIISGFDNAHSIRFRLFQTANRGGEFAAAGGGLGVEFPVFDIPVTAAEFIAEVAHRGEEQSDAGFVAPDVGGFVPDLRHPDAALLRVRVSEEGRCAIELVTEDGEQAADGHGCQCRAGACRRLNVSGVPG
jgi:hypothetical protein